MKYKEYIWIGNNVKVGEGCKIQPYAFIPDGVTLEDNVFVGPGAVFTNDKNPPSNGKGWAKTLVKKNAVIGANATILPGVIIGEGAKIGAGSVVTRNVPDGETWVGNPAKLIKKPLKWAVIGCNGFVAKRHMRAIEDIGDEVYMKWDIEKDYIDVVSSEDWKNVDAVAICTPNYLHFPMMQAMKDKIVICEKPFCLSSQNILALDDNTNVVLQLRHHPEVKVWKNSKIKKGSKCKMTVKMFRDDKYWNSWKGDNSKSGGILFNLGIHYFDLLIYLFGEDYQVIKSNYSDKKCTGNISFSDCDVEYHIEIISDREGQTRKLEINNEEVVLSVKDNLSYEGLHTQIYEDVKKGGGIKPIEAIKSIKLVEKLCQKE